MANINTIKGWIVKANHDLEVTKHREVLPSDAVCFHAQQAAEKMLKAFLIANDVEIDDFHIHDINKLIKECIKIDVEFENLLNIGTGKLTLYAVESRYPADYDKYEDVNMPSGTETEEAVSMAEKTTSFVLRKLNIG